MTDDILDLGIRGRVAVITGAAGGIGREIVRNFSAAGASVAAVDIDKAGLQRIVGEAGPTDEVLPLVRDLSAQADCEDVVSIVARHFGRLDILINNAAILLRQPLNSVQERDIERVCRVNLNSQFFLTRAAAGVMKENQWGRVVNFSSQGGYTGGYDDSIVYNMFKGAVLTMTKGLARQYAGWGILVNAVTPGPVDTSMMETLSPERLKSFLRENVLLNRMASPRELARAALFLGSEWASYITGATLDINGGMYMR